MSYFETHMSAQNGQIYRGRLAVGQRLHRVGLPAVVWRVVRVYRDAQGVEHATLSDETQHLDEKTLSALVLLDRSRYRLI
jgi:hypothetical protein